MSFIEFVVRNPVKATVAVLLVVLFGAIALVRMPMQLTPEVQIPTITIETRWRGASPQEVERQIVLEQEEQLKSVEGVTKMTSECMDSMGRITLEFSVGSDMEESLLKVNSRLQQVPEYPEDADEPVITTSNSSDRPIAWFILSAKQATDADLRAFQQQHPKLAEALEPVRRAHNPGLALHRLRKLADQEPAVRELLPADIEVPKLRRFAEDVIEARFERVRGVSNSNVLGGLEDEMQVVVDPKKLAARQLTIEDVRRALRFANRDTSGGDYWEGKRRYVVRTLGQFRSPQQVADQLLAMRDGKPVFVHNVAKVLPGFKKPDGLVRRFGTSSIAVNVQRETGANVLDVMERLRRANRELNEGPLRTRQLQLVQVYDETEYIYSSINLVEQNIFIGGALTMIVLMLFLHRGVRTPIFSLLIAVTAVAAAYVSPWFFVISLALVLTAGFWFARGALVVGVAIPTSIIGTFFVLDLLGRSLNVVSLAGLAFAVGMLVDNAVVVLENIYRRYQLGERPFVAAVRGSTEVWGAVVASTLTTLAVFLPVMFVQEEAGQLFRDIALAISSAVGLSLAISITVIPTAAARLLGDTRGGGASGEQLDEGYEGAWRSRSPAYAAGDGLPGDISYDDASYDEIQFTSAASRHEPPGNGWVHKTILHPLQSFGEWFVGLVVGINRWLLAGAARGVAFIVGLLGVCALLLWLMWPQVEYLPSGNRNLTFGIVLPPPGYNLDQLMAMGEAIEAGMEPYWNVDPGSEEAEKLDAPVIGDFFYVARGRQVFLGVRAHDPTEAGKLVALVRDVASNLPGTITVAKQSSLFEQGLTAGRTIDIEITGPELQGLVDLGGRIMGLVGQTLPDAQKRPVPSLDLSSPELHFVPKLVRAADLGVNTTDLGFAVNALIDGAYASDYFIGGDKIDLTIIGEAVSSDRSEYAHSQQLKALPVATPTGHLVRLDSLAHVELSSGPEQINRRERQRAITIEVSPPPGMALEDAMQHIRQNIVQPLEESGELAGGYQVTLAGTADKLSKSWDALYFNLVFAAVITYLLMAALFESWLYPLVIISSVVLGMIGGVMGLTVLNLFLAALGEVPQTLDVLTMLGFVILIGTVVNNAILIVHQSLNHMRDEGLPPQEAIVESVRTRIRPIFMTTTTTVLGLMPLVLFPGAGSELYRGLGSVVLGGLVVSTFFTLFLVPTLFNVMMSAKSRLVTLLATRRQEHSPARRPAVAAHASR